MGPTNLSEIPPSLTLHILDYIINYCLCSAMYVFHLVLCYDMKTLFLCAVNQYSFHYDVIKWKHFPRYWPFVRGIHRSPVNSPHKGQWRGALMFSLIFARTNGWVNTGEAGDFRRNHAHYDVIVMLIDLATIDHDYRGFTTLLVWVNFSSAIDK